MRFKMYFFLHLFVFLSANLLSLCFGCIPFVWKTILFSVQTFAFRFYIIVQNSTVAFENYG